VDTNMGYNKSNAVTEMKLEYAVNLADLQRPTAQLNILQENHATLDVPCLPYAQGLVKPQEAAPGEIPDPLYNMQECHWGYLRVYLPQGAALSYANPQEIPETAAWLGKTIPARTDDLGNEDILGAQVYGMMTLTPTGKTHESIFEYSLPAQVATYDSASGAYTYRLTAQKQPGTLARPFVISLILPEGAEVISAAPLQEKDGVWSAQLDLQKDILLEVRFIVK